jgi:outer membrane protein OmpA-like peptidoglycan-associated protein
MKKFVATLLTTLLMSAPAFANSFGSTTSDPAASRDKTAKGAVIGGVLGAAAGAIISNNRNGHSPKRGAVVGAVAGTAAGAIVGAMIDKQERELRQIPGVDVQRTADNQLNVSVKNEVLFDYNSASLRSASRSTLQEMADVFQKYPQTTLRVEGHTDSTGSASYNQRLSERRANSVASFIENMGVSTSRIDAIGYGESQPRAENSTASGRQMNRRVEIKVVANQA